MDEERKPSPVGSAVNESIRPDFLGGSGSRESASPSAAEDLGTIEKAASNGDLLEKKDNGLDEAKETEKSGGFFTGSGKSDDKSKKKKGKFKGGFKKGGPIIAIFMAIFGFSGMIGGAQMLMPFSLMAQFQETFNSMHTSANMRSNVLFRMQMSSGNIKDPIKANLFGKEKFRTMSSRQQSRLAAQGIEVDNDFNGTGERVLKFDDGTGKTVIVTADADTAARIGDGAVDFKTLYETNADFFNGYNKGSVTWRGAISNWFGTMTVKFLQSNKITRNMFKDFQQKVQDTNAGNTRTVAMSIMEEGADSIKQDGGEVKRIEEEVETDENGEPKVVLKDAEETIPSSTIDKNKIKTKQEVQAQLTKIQEQFEGANKGAGAISKAANYSCLVVNFLGGVSLLATASEALQIIKVVTGYFEAIQKTQAGDGDGAPINELAAALVEPMPGEYGDPSDGDVTINTKPKAAMESSGIASMYGGGKVNPNDPSVRSFSFSSSIKTVLGGIGVSMTAFKTCAIAKLAANAISVGVTAASIIACIAGVAAAVGTAGAGTAAAAAGCAGIFGNIALSIGIGVAAGSAIGAVISVISPFFARIFTRDLISNLGGEDLGNALVSGANMYQGMTHRSNGGSLTNRDGLIAFRASQQEVIAENARYERQTKSPFDASSKYTFMGSLLNGVVGLSTSSSIVGLMTNIGSTTMSSILAMSPAVSAYNVSDGLLSEAEFEQDCPYLDSIGAIGDAFCNPYIITDTNTINDDPIDVIAKLDKEGNFMSDPVKVGTDGLGNETTNVAIKGDSDLAKYILFCDNRTSAFGIADQNIVNSVSDWGQVSTSSGTFNNAMNSAIGSVPLVGDLIDVVDNAQALANAGYIGGESCVSGNDDWETNRYYQRFIEDQSLAETMGLIEESAVTAFLNDYYEKNPLDNSYEGILARYSGLTKETVVALLDIIEYGNYIANYHPEERYYFGEPKLDVDGEEIKFNNSDVVAEWYLPFNSIVFADVRNRSFAV